MTRLKSETNTPAMERRILNAFDASGYERPTGTYNADFEHGQWWITELDTGRQWSVVDAVPGIDGFDFEVVSEGASYRGLDGKRARKFCVTARSPREAARKLEGLGARGPSKQRGDPAAFINDNDRANALKGYLDVALWASTDNSDESGGSPLDENYGIDDIPSEEIEKARKDVDDFLDHAAETANLRRWAGAHDFEQIGQDFWLTRNGHGAGFWDREAPGSELGRIGKELTEAAHSFGEEDLYVGDDGKLYFAGG